MTICVFKVENLTLFGFSKSTPTSAEDSAV